MMLPLFAVAQAMEEKKEREPIFVLPDVVITGESEIKVGGEKRPSARELSGAAKRDTYDGAAVH